MKDDWGWMEPYYTAKAGIQDRVREAGFTHWTLLKPGCFMENLLPSEAIVFPRGTEGGLVTLLKPAPRLSLVAVDVIGAAAAAAVAAPGRFDRVEPELASDLLTMREIAEILGEHLGTTLTAPDMTEEEAVAGGMSDMGFGQSALDERPPARAARVRP